MTLTAMVTTATVKAMTTGKRRFFLHSDVIYKKTYSLKTNSRKMWEDYAHACRFTLVIAVAVNLKLLLYVNCKGCSYWIRTHVCTGTYQCQPRGIVCPHTPLIEQCVHSYPRSSLAVIRILFTIFGSTLPFVSFFTSRTCI